ncbi:hypothetical protein EYZ11_011395 [Aspergillus tanneri]|nr:hypothetical protein EYZ11_011395 [Aspergillus tanneri]
MSLRSHGGEKTSLRAILDQIDGDILVHVFSRTTRKQLREEFERACTRERYPHITLTSVGMSTYPVSIYASISDNALEGIEGLPRFLISDPKKQFLDAMGFVRPSSTSKASATRMRRQGPLRCGFFIVRKDKTLFAKETGTLENVYEAIIRAEKKLHKGWISDLKRMGRPVPPW